MPECKGGGEDSALARVQGGVANYFLCIAPSEEEESAKGNKESITIVCSYCIANNSLPGSSS